MKYFIISIRDRAADVFGYPSFHVSQNAAIRGFTDEVNRPVADNMFYKHPDDFDMFSLGTFDDADGSFQLDTRPKQIAVGKDLVKADLPEGDVRRLAAVR